MELLKKLRDTMTEQLIKDHPDLVKDSKSGAVLLKRPKTINNIEIDNLKKRVSKLEAEVKLLREQLLTTCNIMKAQNEIIRNNMETNIDIINQL